MSTVVKKDPIGKLNLPPGFRFYPTDEELIVHYLCRKVAGYEFSIHIIGDVDLYKFDPWDLPEKAVFGEKEWYFFSPRDRKYPNGSRPNRVAGCGYWKATGTDKVIVSKGIRNVGVKKALVFYMGKAPHGTKTNWIMHEFRLFESPRSTCTSKLDDWVLCRIYKKSSSAAKSSVIESSNKNSVDDGSSTSSEVSQVHEDRETIVADDGQKLVLENYGPVTLDWGVLAGLTAGPDIRANGPAQVQAQQQSGTCVPSSCNVDSSLENLGYRVVEEDEEIKSGPGTVQVNGNMMWAHNYNSAEPFEVTYMF